MGFSPNGLGPKCKSAPRNSMDLRASVVQMVPKKGSKNRWWWELDGSQGYQRGSGYRPPAQAFIRLGPTRHFRLARLLLQVHRDRETEGSCPRASLVPLLCWIVFIAALALLAIAIAIASRRRRARGGGATFLFHVRGRSIEVCISWIRLPRVDEFA